VNPFIRISTTWSDDDALQLQFEVFDGASTSVNSAYAPLDWFSAAANALERFGQQIHGGLHDLEAGTPGPEFAGGAFVARFHWYKPTALFISTRQQSDFFEFKGNQVAREATMFLRTEPGLLDHFVANLRAAGTRQRSDAMLECVRLGGA